MRRLPILLLWSALLASCIEEVVKEEAPELSALAVTISGLPASVAAEVTVTGPNQFTGQVFFSTTLSNLAPGIYTVSANPVSSGGTTYTPSPATQHVTVTSGSTASVTVPYAGPPPPPTVTLSANPSTITSGQSSTLSWSTSNATSCSAGWTSSTATSGSQAVTPTATTTYSMTCSGPGGSASGNATVTVNPPPLGALAVTISGLPGSVPADVTVTGPNQFTAQVFFSTTLSNLAPGTYTILANPVSSGGTTYTPSPGSQQVTVTSGSTANATVTYSGPPPPPTVTLSANPSTITSGQSSTLSWSTSNATSCSASWTSSTATSGSQAVTPTATTTYSMTFSGPGGSASGSATVTVNPPPTGSLTVTITGLPANVPADVTVTGNQFSGQVFFTTTLSNLAPGTYTVSANSVSSGGTTYTPSPAGQQVTVTSGSTASRTVTYGGSPAPQIFSVSPNPVPGSDSPQPFTIIGQGFLSGANVFLRDLTAGQPFPNRQASSFTGTQIVLNPIFTTAAHQWSVEVINPDNQSSGQFVFQVVTVDALAHPVGSTGTATEGNDGDGWYVAQNFMEFNSAVGKYHLGEDWNAESGGNTDCGSAVYAIGGGTIVFAGNGGTGWGNVLIIRHTLPDGTQVESLYGHVQSFVRSSGSVVKRELVALIGNGGGEVPLCHLHLEIRTPSSASWGVPGIGYTSSPTAPSGWVDPTDYINSH